MCACLCLPPNFLVTWNVYRRVYILHTVLLVGTKCIDMHTSIQLHKFKVRWYLASYLDSLSLAGCNTDPQRDSEKKCSGQPKRTYQTACYSATSCPRQRCSILLQTGFIFQLHTLQDLQVPHGTIKNGVHTSMCSTEFATYGRFCTLLHKLLIQMLLKLSEIFVKECSCSCSKFVS